MEAAARCSRQALPGQTRLPHVPRRPFPPTPRTEFEEQTKRETNPRRDAARLLWASGVTRGHRAAPPRPHAGGAEQGRCRARPPTFVRRTGSAAPHRPGSPAAHTAPQPRLPAWGAPPRPASAVTAPEPRRDFVTGCRTLRKKTVILVMTRLGGQKGELPPAATRRRPSSPTAQRGDPAPRTPLALPGPAAAAAPRAALPLPAPPRAPAALPVPVPVPAPARHLPGLCGDGCVTAGGDGGEGTGCGGGTGRALPPHRAPGALPGTQRHRATPGPRATPVGSGLGTPEAAPRHLRSAALSPGWKLRSVGIPVPAGSWAGCESAGSEHPGARPAAGRGDAPVNEGVGHLSELPLGGVNQPQLGLRPNPTSSP